MAELERIKQEVSLLDYIQSSGQKVQRAGKVYRVDPCPVCGHKDHFTIYPDTNSYFSFSGCCNGGSIIDYLIEVESMDQAQAIKKAEALGQPKGSGGEADRIRIKDRAAVRRQQGGSSENIAPEEDITEAEKEEARSIIEQAANNTCQYYYSRGLTDKTIKEYKLGYLPGGHEYGQQYKYLLPVDEYSYTVRSDKPDALARYRNKGKKSLFNKRYLQQPSLTGRHIYITEGVIDALSLEELDRPAVAIDSVTGAGKLLEEVAANKDNLQGKLFVIALDSDKAGQEAAEKVRAGLQAMELQAVIYDLGGYKDINEALTADREALEERLEALQYKGSIYEYLSDGYELDQIKRIQEPDIKTGLKALDHTLGGGLYPGLYILGAISSLGKTALALQIADAIAAAGQQVLFFSLEMGRYEMTCRSLARVLLEQTASEDITTGHIIKSCYKGRDLYGQEAFKEALEAYRAGPAKYLYLVEGDFNITIDSIKAQAKKHEALTGTRPVIFIDYLQAIQPEPESRLTDKQHIDRAVIALKRLSRDMDLPIIAISSFNRSSYKEEGGPSMAAFKESGSIEFTADVLLSMQIRTSSDKPTNTEINEAKNKEPRPISLVILKNRRGKAYDEIELSYYPKQNYFKEA